MRTTCKRCGAALSADATAYICSYECTFCPDCAVSSLGGTCPNCGGQLVIRPKRRVQPSG